MEDFEPKFNFIYKFYSPTEYSLDALLNQYFWFSKRAYLNDPFDLGNYRKGRAILSMQLFRKIVQTIPNPGGLEYNQILSKIPEYASCSFTRDALSKQMWAYYAKDYSGWCLGFTRGKLSVKQESILSPAIYVDDNCAPTHPINIGLYGTNMFDNLIRQVLCVKHVSWQHEQEERLIIKMKSMDSGDLRKWNSFQLREIIIGNKMTSPYTNIICRFASLYNVPVYKVTTNNSVDFQLSAKRVQ